MIQSKNEVQIKLNGITLIFLMKYVEMFLEFSTFFSKIVSAIDSEFEIS